MSDLENKENSDDRNTAVSDPSIPSSGETSSKRARSPESLVSSEERQGKKSKKDKKSRRLDPEDIQLIAKEMFSLMNMANSSGSSSQVSSEVRVAPDTGVQDNSVQDSDASGSVIARQGSEQEDGISIHAPSRFTENSGDSKVSGKSAVSRVNEDFPDEDDVFTKQSERVFKKTLLLLSEVLGDKLPSRPLSNAGLRGMSDRGDSLGQDVDKKCFPHSSDPFLF